MRNGMSIQLYESQYTRLGFLGQMGNGCQHDWHALICAYLIIQYVVID
jgi:hypothetical protein